MDFPKIISFLKENYPYNADEIYECLNLLVDTFEVSFEAIQKSSTEALNRRDFLKANFYVEMASEINNLEEKIKEYMNQLRVEVVEEAEGLGVTEGVIDEQEETSQEDYDEVLQEGSITDLDHNEYKVDSSIKHSLHEYFRFKKPAAFEIDSTRFEVKNWKDLFLLTCKLLVDIDLSKFESFTSDPSMNGRKVKYFSKTRIGVTIPRKLARTNIYISMQHGANEIRDLIIKMLRKYNIDTQRYTVYFSEDYSTILKK